MKHLFLSFSLAALTGVAFANPVSVQTAQTAASNFITRKVGSNAVLTLTSSVPSNTATAQPSFYIFDVNNGKGFVIVSGEDAVTPILGYSTSNIFPAQVTNKEVAYWLNNYNQQISAVISNHIAATEKVTADWKRYTTAPDGNTASKVTDVAPMILTTWDQMNPYSSTDNTLYNNLCPTSTPTGCVATAMAQIMNYWKNPTTGVGMHTYSDTLGGQPYSLTANFASTTYDWVNMPNQLHNNSATAQKNAIATLMYDCGVAVNMHYDYASNDGSGAYVINYGYGLNVFACSQNALPAYFGYKSTIKGYQRVSFSDTQWVNMLKFEIDNGRPTLCTGQGSLGGHAFDFDGYDNNNMFDINWGWSGQSNGYFTVDNLAPFSVGVGGGNGNFNQDEEALIMIEPANSSLPANPVYPDFPTKRLALSGALTNPSDTIIFNTSYALSGVIKNIGTQTLSQGKLYLYATNNADPTTPIMLSSKTATIVANGTNTFAYTTTGNADLVPGVYTIRYRYMVDGSIDTTKLLVGDGTGSNLATLMVKPAPTSISNVALNGATLNVYPNPSHDVVTLDWTGYTGKVNTVELFNIVGQKLASYTNINGNNTKIPVNQLSAGNYIVNIVTDLGTMSKEISVK